MKTLFSILIMTIICAVLPAQKVMRDYVRIVYGGDTLDIKLSGDSVVLLTNQKILKLRKDFRAARLYQGTDTVLSGRAMATDTANLTPRCRYDTFIDASGNVYMGKSNRRGGWVKLNYILPLFFFFKRRRFSSNRRVFLIFPLLLLPLFINAQVGNEKVINSMVIATVTDTFKKEVLATKYALDKVKTLDVQVDWSGLTGTLDGKIVIQQRGEPTMQWTCPQPTETDPGNLVKTLSTAAGSYTFTLWAWNANDLRILFVKNNCTGGIINASLGLRR